MSASLVGSEMCIRDRRFCKEWLGYVDDLTARTGRALDGVWSTDAEYETVSYTHLTLPTICSV
eukprot:1628804-Alexandrium_andersonii.AAC.1